MSPHLLTARSLSETLGVSAETVLRWTRRGEVPALRLPSGAIRYRPAQIEQWLAARQLQNSDGPAGHRAERKARDGSHAEVYFP